MDENKDKALVELDYEVKKTCGQCAYFIPGKADFGTCSIQSYQHLKHSGEPRKLSVNIYGACNKFQWSIDAHARLGLFAKYVK